MAKYTDFLKEKVYVFLDTCVAEKVAIKLKEARNITVSKMEILLFFDCVPKNIDKCNVETPPDNFLFCSQTDEEYAEGAKLLENM